MAITECVLCECGYSIFLIFQKKISSDKLEEKHFDFLLFFLHFYDILKSC